MTSNPAEKTSLPLPHQFRRILFHRPTYDFLTRHSGVIALVIFLMVGILVLDDYGVSVDEDEQRRIANQNVELIMGREPGDFKAHHHHRFYGVAFELPLVLVERALGMGEDYRRGFHIQRHIITHIFFLAGGFFCYLLTYRMFNSRILALIAMLLFLLHPRMYAHSFFNTKDIPFMSMFMIALFLTYRAFKKDGIMAFMLCGLGIGVLINLRMMGAVLFATVLAVRVLDLYQASDNNERKHILTTIAALILATIWIFYLITPTIWANPVGLLMEWATSLNENTVNARQMFRGELFYSKNFHPPEYISVWSIITTPPLMLTLGIIGTFAILFRYVMHPSDIFRNTTFRFGLVLISCVAIPIALAIYTDFNNIYNGWRQVYFLYAPFCIIAIFGLHWMLSNIISKYLRGGVYATVGVGIIVTVAAMAAIHPHEQVYFNFLLDRTTPEHIRSQYDFDYWGAPQREAVEYLFEKYPDSSLYLWTPDESTTRLNLEIMPRKTDNPRVQMRGDDPDFYITNYREIWSGGDFEEPSDAGIYTRTIYNNTLFTILPVNPSRVEPFKVPDLQEIEQIYKSAVSKPPVWLSNFNLHLDGNKIIYIKSPCDTQDTAERFFLYVFPNDPDDLPERRQRLGFDNLDFDFEDRGGMLDDKCVARAHLPEYDIAAIETGQLTPDENRIWGARIHITDQALPSPAQ